ncbi:MAG: hypothetical protein PHX21_13895 [bacterium]|nr:hypothetical protein [bacterium]
MKKLPIKVVNDQTKKTVRITIGKQPPSIPDWLYTIGQGILAIFLLQVLPKPPKNDNNDDVKKLN